MKNQVFASRVLTVAGDSDIKITLNIYIPFRPPELRDYRCDFEILGPNGFKETMYGVGIDTLGAVQSALANAAVLLKSINRTDFGGKLRWLSDENENLGF